MFADRAYSRGLVASPDRLASLLYFAAAVPTVGFIHGAADLSPHNTAAGKTTRSLHRSQHMPSLRCPNASPSAVLAVSIVTPAQVQVQAVA